MSTKTCSRCTTEKPITDFYTNGKTLAGTIKHKPTCKKCEGEAKMDRYWKIIAEVHPVLECESCGYSKCKAALEFHHEDPMAKEGSISKMKSHSKARILEELAKCKLLCANCHREAHNP